MKTLATTIVATLCLLVGCSSSDSEPSATDAVTIPTTKLLDSSPSTTLGSQTTTASTTTTSTDTTGLATTTASTATITRPPAPLCGDGSRPEWQQTSEVWMCPAPSTTTTRPPEPECEGQQNAVWRGSRWYCVRIPIAEAELECRRIETASWDSSELHWSCVPNKTMLRECQDALIYSADSSEGFIELANDITNSGSDLRLIEITGRLDNETTCLANGLEYERHVICTSSSWVIIQPVNERDANPVVNAGRKCLNGLREDVGGVPLFTLETTTTTTQPQSIPRTTIAPSIATTITCENEGRESAEDNATEWASLTESNLREDGFTDEVAYYWIDSILNLSSDLLRPNEIACLVEGEIWVAQSKTNDALAAADANYGFYFDGVLCLSEEPSAWAWNPNESGGLTAQIEGCLTLLRGAQPESDIFEPEPNSGPQRV